jgi:hypothetical protein
MPGRRGGRDGLRFDDAVTVIPHPDGHEAVSAGSSAILDESTGVHRVGRTAMPVVGNVVTVARYALGGIRILNGTLGLLAPGFIIRRFGDPAPDSNAAAVYGLRLFGIRTVLIGLDLIRLRRPELDRSLRSAVLIHASDTATVLALWRRGQLAPAMARPLTLISGLNTALALTAALGSRRSTS